MWNNVSVPTSYVACQKSLFCRQLFASRQGSGRQISFHIEICMGIDELKPNRYVRTKIRPIEHDGVANCLRIASELAEFCSFLPHLGEASSTPRLARWPEI